MARIVVPVLDFARSGGSRVLSRLASEWQDMGHSVTVVTHRDTDAPYFPTKADVEYVDSAGRLTERSRAGVVAPHIKVLALRRSLGRIRPDVAVANHNLTAWSVASAPGIRRRLYYVQAYEPEYYHSGALGRRLVLSAAARATYHLPLTRLANSPLYLRYRDLRCIDWIPPGVDLTTFSPRRHVGVASPVTVGCIGRKEVEKGTADVVDAFLRLRGEGVDARLRVAYGNIDQAVADRNDVDVVVPRDDGELGDFYRSLDVLVAPGHLQLGAVHYPVLEGMACGVPVIHTGYLPGTSNVSDVVPVKSPRAIATMISHVLARPASETQARLIAARGVAEEYAWGATAQRWSRYFE